VDTVHNKLTRYDCDVCDYSSYTRAQVETHSNTVHLGKKNFKCDICDKAFSEKGHLNVHVNSLHKKLTRHTCDLCDYSSYQRANLERHSLAVHHRKKTFTCDICDKAFSVKSGLAGHVKRVHKQFKNCKLCSYTSCTKHELENHLILKHAHQNNGSDDLVKPHILIKEEDQMPETYSDHKYFEDILLEPTEIEINEEFVADPLAIDIDDKEAKVKQEK
jgi:uncharacterized Zn-finger protein